MFCPKCGTQNPETGRFCRSCGADLGNVSAALSGKLPQPQNLVNSKGKPVSWEGAITKFFMGIAFLTVSVVLGVSGKGNGWWFWMLIPAFSMIGAGVAQYIQLKKSESQGITFAPQTSQNALSSAPINAALPSAQTEFVSPDNSRYKTGDLVPPSIIESTTRHLEMDSEGETMTLPKPEASKK
ncbi:MAG TPA: zinc-ribbon domain-containing protein [Pyrinomonadaceae bacterium]|mgnify:CR=1 FL=1|nr:zinc-ribbon domain-containing protein [Pyrinomonadaceae bacterium]